jgi:hypothetical protein
LEIFHKCIHPVFSKGTGIVKKLFRKGFLPTGCMIQFLTGQAPGNCHPLLMMYNAGVNSKLEEP